MTDVVGFEKYRKYARRNCDRFLELRGSDDLAKDNR